jgi:hypothetical protein
MVVLCWREARGACTRTPASGVCARERVPPLTSSCAPVIALTACMVC